MVGLHVIARALLAVSPAVPEWPEVKRELERCAELRRAMIQAGWFNQRFMAPPRTASGFSFHGLASTPSLGVERFTRGC
jgi:hypothetical protein